MTKIIKPVSVRQPHPYALLVPPLSEEEYDGLKADIKENGLMYPVMVDEDDLVLDGVHRTRICDELGIPCDAIVVTGKTDEEKRTIALGLNLKRRHLDVDKRRAFVRKLHNDEKMSLAKITKATGYSKATICRDLKASPFEAMITGYAELAEAGKDIAPGVSEINDHMTHLAETMLNLERMSDAHWKAGTEPDDLNCIAHIILKQATHHQFINLVAQMNGEPNPQCNGGRSWIEGQEETECGAVTLLKLWGTWSPEEKDRQVARMMTPGKLCMISTDTLMARNSRSFADEVRDYRASLSQ